MTVLFSGWRAPLDDVFVGRKAELAQVAEVVARVKTGQPWLLTIEGDSGIGKTAFIRRCAFSSTGATVLWARADQAESDFGYGVVTQLTRDVKGRLLDKCPLLTGETLYQASAFAVGAELLGVIGALQAAGPVVIVVDDLQWADGRSVDALSFMLRRLSVDPVLMAVAVRGDRDNLDEPGRRMLQSVERRLHLQLTGLDHDDVGPLASALGAPVLRPEVIQRIYESTAGHSLYLQTVLRDRESLDRWGPGSTPIPRSLAAAIGDQLALLPTDSRSLVETLAVANVRVPLVQLGAAASVASPSRAIEPAVRAGLVDWWPAEPSCPVEVRHALQRDAIYAGLRAGRRRELHARAIALVDETAAWAHRVAALDHPDENLAAQLEQLASDEAAKGRLPLAATYLQWASDVSPARPDRERRLLTAALHLTLAEEARGQALRPAVETAAPCGLRSCVLGTMDFAAGQLADAELHFSEALEEAESNPAEKRLAAVAANRLAGTYTLLGAGEKVMEMGRRALATHALDPAAEGQTRTLVSIGASQVGGPRLALKELEYLGADPAGLGPADADGLSFRGVFQLLSGDLPGAIGDLSASIKLARQGAIFTLGLRAYFYLALALYLSGQWDDALLMSEQGFSAAEIHPRRYERPLLHLAAACVPAGRGAMADAEQHVKLAEAAAETLDYGQERLYAGMARALLCQALGDYQGMAAALGHWQEEAGMDDRSRLYGVLWRPLLVEGLAGSGRLEEAAVALKPLRSQADGVAYLEPGLAWLEGWLAEQEGDPETALDTYQRGIDMANKDSPVYSARLSLALGRLLRRTGQRRAAVEHLRQANKLYVALEAAPFIAQTEEELAACGLPQEGTRRRSVLDLTSRESEVAHLVAKRMTNNEIAAELFITPNTVEYHLTNIYVKFGVKGRHELRRALAASLSPV
ncbi:MAG TPA: AAA family ATPase [Acidimicrobiales bacterium]|nr:AAA family ATPase [Acidimicrobiales bacterium]